ncbi:MAG: septum formation initiator family protein [Bacteroidota bacterium]
MKQILNKFPSFLKSFYFLTSGFFLIWIMFVDSNDLFYQFELVGKQRHLQQSKEFYDEQILEVKNQKASLQNDPAALERLAREKYLMKKESEDLYIVVSAKKSQ